MNSNAPPKIAFTFVCVFSLLNGTTLATQPPPTGDPCQADWDSRQPFSTVDNLIILKSIEREAERGETTAQYRLGMIRSTKDGSWKAPEDHSYNIKWLKKAIQGGSKSAAAKLAEIEWLQIKPRRINYDTYLEAQIAAAESDRNPWLATALMYQTNGRVGGRTCPEDQRANGWCINHEHHPLLPFTDAQKWAEIAAEGGNPAAQEWLCRAASDGLPEYGQPKDDKTSFKWCLIASHNSCSSTATENLAIHYKEGRGTKKDEVKASFWHNINNQLWRRNASIFFIPQQ